METTLPPILETKLADFRRRVWIVKLLEGALGAVFGIALSYLVVFGLDRVMETPAALRWAILLTLAITLGLTLPLKWHRWVWRQRRLEDAARLLRRKLPRLGDQLLGIVELARMDHGNAGRSERLVQAAIQQTAEAVKGQDFTQAVPHARHRQWGLAAVGGLALMIALFFGVNGAARNAFARWIAPWANIDRYTFARVEKVPQRLVVPVAEPFQLPLKLAADTQRTPEEGKGRIGKQPAVHAKLASGEYPFAFPPQKADSAMSISVGDIRKQVQVAPRPRPELTELVVRMKLPDYLQYKSEPRIEAHGGAVSVLRGTKAAFEAKASRPLAHAELDGATQAVSGDIMLTSYQPVTEDAERKFTWQDRDGLTPRDPLILKIRAVEDEAPKIMARRETLEQVVLESEVLTFDLTSSDDFGIKRVGLQWIGSKTEADGKTPIHGEKITAGGDPEKKEMEARATFCALREGVAPQTLELRAWADDYLPKGHRARSAAFVVHVLNKTDHALWLTEQLGKWLEAAKESYEKEQQLHQTNKEMREMSAADLDRPENRRKVSQQAAAENANAARLDSLTASGRNLVEQATRNDEFEAKKLENWAEMVKALKDIAEKRMPSVADLLKQSASAPAKAGQQGDSKPGENGDKTAKSGDSKPGDSKPGDSKPGDGKPGEAKPGEQTAQNGDSKPGDSKPGDGKPGDGKPSSNQAKSDTPPQPGDSGKSQSAPSVTQGGNHPPNPNAPKPGDGPPKPPVPSIVDNEKGFLPQDEAKPKDPNAKGPPPSKGKLGLPSTTLAKAPGSKDDAPQPPDMPSWAQDKLDNAINEQKDLLAEFAKVSDQLSEILASLEASTFVKRFKAASRKQINIASTINKKTLDAFGIEGTPAPAAKPIAIEEKTQSEIVRTIQEDLEAYFERKQDAHFKNILDEMKKKEIVRALQRGGEKLTINLAAQSMNSSEFWADTLDRWAEELVKANNSKGKPKPGADQDSLPPEIILKVMQALRDEMKLREETRETQTAKPALEPEKYESDARELSAKQAANSKHTQGAIDDIRSLQDGAQKFGKELQLLDAVVAIMDENTGILHTPDTGPKAIAAETEAIELLLQAKREGGGGGGGGGANPGGGGSGTTKTAAALAQLGPGGDAESQIAPRAVGQATGRAGKEFPDEFKPGLEAYFNLLEGGGAQK
jgi:hypothetical protein